MLNNLRILSIFVLILQIILSSCVKQEVPTLNNTAFNYSIKTLDEDNKQDTAKINQLDTEINTLSSEIQNLASSVNSRLSSLNTQSQSLASHINTITKKQYITFDPIDKPDSAGSYFDKAYFLGLDLRNMLSDVVTLYAPDSEDPDQDNLKETWEVNQDRVEVLDPSDLFDSIKAFSDEIQTAKDLISDYQNNVFVNEDKAEAIQVLDTLINNINEYWVFLKS